MWSILEIVDRYQPIQRQSYTKHLSQKFCAGADLETCESCSDGGGLISGAVFLSSLTFS